MLSVLVASSLGIATGIFAFVAGVALTGSWLASAVIAAFAAGLVSLWAHRSPSLALDAGACSRGLKISSGVATLLALIVLARLASL